MRTWATAFALCACAAPLLAQTASGPISAGLEAVPYSLAEGSALERDLSAAVAAFPEPGSGQSALASFESLVSAYRSETAPERRSALGDALRALIGDESLAAERLAEAGVKRRLWDKLQAQRRELHKAAKSDPAVAKAIQDVPSELQAAPASEAEPESPKLRTPARHLAMVQLSASAAGPRAASDLDEEDEAGAKEAWAAEDEFPIVRFMFAPEPPSEPAPEPRIERPQPRTKAEPASPLDLSRLRDSVEAVKRAPAGGPANKVRDALATLGAYATLRPYADEMREIVLDHRLRVALDRASGPAVAAKAALERIVSSSAVRARWRSRLHRRIWTILAATGAAAYAAGGTSTFSVLCLSFAFAYGCIGLIMAMLGEPAFWMRSEHRDEIRIYVRPGAHRGDGPIP